MTPEACLSQMSVNHAVFEDVGLLVFDECHLLHSGEEGRGRRALDAMLCVLNFGALAPEANYLFLSAMMKNTAEVAGWISQLTGQKCLSLALPWKPTRQLRGSVVYGHERVNALSARLAQARSRGKTSAPSKSDKESLGAKPLGLFSLKQTWATRDTKDYALLKLLDQNVLLGASKFWHLTPNSGVVASAIAAAAAQTGIKTLIFFQTIRNAVSATEKLEAELGAASIALRQDESVWLETAALEMGGMEHLYLRVDDGSVLSPAVVHHGLLLPEERYVCESLYQRPDGVRVMAATSTVAQGMNFPSELVIIAEDSRFDEAKNRREVLGAQELLNAAGRAGRAGQNANGIVLVVPGRVVGINFKDAMIGNHWSALQTVFGQSDQCLDIDDPLTAVVDRVHANVDAAGEVERYAIARLASPGAASGTTEQLSKAIDGSLAAFRARQRNDEEWIKSRIATAAQFHAAQAPEAEEKLAEVQVASTMGLPLTVVSRLSESLKSIQADRNTRISHWRKWFFDWLVENPDLLDQVFRPETLTDLFGTSFERLDSASKRTAFAVPLLRKMTQSWMHGHPLRDLELALGVDAEKLKACTGARKFVLRAVPELAYLFNVPALLVQRQQATSIGPQAEMPAAIGQLGRCVRQGFRNYEQAALSYLLRTARLSRRQLHQQYALIKGRLENGGKGEKWDAVVARVEAASLAELNSRA